MHVYWKPNVNFDAISFSEQLIGDHSELQAAHTVLKAAQDKVKTNYIVPDRTVFKRAHPHLMAY